MLIAASLSPLQGTTEFHSFSLIQIMNTQNITARPAVQISWISRASSSRLVIAGIFSFLVLHQLYTVNDTTRLLLFTHCTSSYYTLSSASGSSINNEDDDEDDKNPENRTTSSFLLETFALSFDPTKVEKLQERNNHSNIGTNIVWVPSTDGMQQRSLDLWAQLTNHGHAPMTLEAAAQLHKYHYESPHAVGCYLAHWHLLRTLAQRPPELLLQLDKSNNNDNQNKTNKHKKQQPQYDNQTRTTRQHAYLILEDDAACAPGLKEEIERTIQQLPSDWDMLFVGGKPFSYFDEWNNHNPNHHESNNNETTRMSSLQGNMTHGKLLLQEYEQIANAIPYNGTTMDDMIRRLRRAVCQGDFGQARGPLAPDGSRRLLPPPTPGGDGTTNPQQEQQEQHQAYWRSDYLTNTQSYVVNPQRVAHVARLLHPTADVPVDIRLGDLMQSHQINVYMTTRAWCEQRPPDAAAPLLAPQAWQGFFAFSQGRPGAWHYIWQTQIHLSANDNDNGQVDCAF
jgi:GR25 family glycosyltransferase involved in LPS biosynthesis